MEKGQKYDFNFGDKVKGSSGKEYRVLFVRKTSTFGSSDEYYMLQNANSIDGVAIGEYGSKLTLVKRESKQPLVVSWVTNDYNRDPIAYCWTDAEVKEQIATLLNTPNGIYKESIRVLKIDSISKPEYSIKLSKV